MPEILQSLVPYVVGGLLLLAALLFLLALRYFRAGRREPYWRMRRSASLHGWQLFIISLTLFFVASAVCLFTGFAQLVLGGPAQTSDMTLNEPSSTPVIITATPEATNSPSPTSVAENTATPDELSPTDSPRPSSTALQQTPIVPLSPTPTTESTRPSPTPVQTAPVSPSPEITPFVLTPLISDVTPPAEARLEITALDSEITEDFMPVSPRTTFEVGITRVYFWVTYSALPEGVAWARLLLRDGVPVQGGAYLWSGDQAGTTAYFFGNADGFPPGEYEIQILLGDEVLSTATFSVQ